jgi:hypothetical protein
VSGAVEVQQASIQQAGIQDRSILEQMPETKPRRTGSHRAAKEMGRNLLVDETEARKKRFDLGFTVSDAWVINEAKTVGSSRQPNPSSMSYSIRNIPTDGLYRAFLQKLEPSRLTTRR